MRYTGDKRPFLKPPASFSSLCALSPREETANLHLCQKRRASVGDAPRGGWPTYDVLKTRQRQVTITQTRRISSPVGAHLQSGIGVVGRGRLHMDAETLREAWFDGTRPAIRLVIPSHVSTQ